MTIKSFIKNERGIIQLIMLAVALLIIFVVIQVLPMVNSSVASSITIPGYRNNSNTSEGGLPGSEWNDTVNTALVNASSMWSSVGGIFKVTLIVAIIAVLLAYLFSVIPTGGKFGGGGGL